MRARVEVLKPIFLMAQKTQKEAQAIQERWNLRKIMRQIASSLPDGYIVTNTTPVQKEIRKCNGNVFETYWTCWVRNKKEKALAVLKGERVKLISQNELELYHMHSLKHA